MRTLIAFGLILFGFPSQDVPSDVQSQMLFDFNDQSIPWRSVDDVVMGGVSSSRMRVEGDVAVFAGTLSLDNNGGFASVRSQAIQSNLEGFTGFRLRVRGDGRTYQLRARTNRADDGSSYRMSFETIAHEWIEVSIPIPEMVPTYRGRVLSGRPKLSSEMISSLGILIADKKEGEFSLEVDWIEVHR